MNKLRVQLGEAREELARARETHDNAERTYQYQLRVTRNNGIKAGVVGLNTAFSEAKRLIKPTPGFPQTRLAFVKILRDLHPDRNQKEGAKAAFQKLSEHRDAYREENSEKLQAFLTSRAKLYELFYSRKDMKLITRAEEKVRRIKRQLSDMRASRKRKRVDSVATNEIVVITSGIASTVCIATNTPNVFKCIASGRIINTSTDENANTTVRRPEPGYRMFKQRRRIVD